jgi:hypothetical protein
LQIARDFRAFRFVLLADFSPAAGLKTVNPCEFTSLTNLVSQSQVSSSGFFDRWPGTPESTVQALVQPSGERPKIDKNSSRSKAGGSPSGCRGGRGCAQVSGGTI